MFLLPAYAQQFPVDRLEHTCEATYSVTLIFQQITRLFYTDRIPLCFTKHVGCCHLRKWSACYLNTTLFSLPAKRV